MTMEESFRKYLEENPGIALISKEDVDKIKIKMGKSRRKESDWMVIKEILYKHDLITAAPQNRIGSVRDISNVLCEKGVLIAFTNFDDCERHLKGLYERDSRIGSMFQITSLSFEDVIMLADAEKKDLYIDIQDKPNTMFMAYLHETRAIKAMMIGR